jgi:putative alpha-1,2-mannosidase
VIHRALQTLFTAQPDGLPGNDDLGALSSWYVWSALGLYPAIPGVAGFAIVNPLFSHETITLGNAGRLSLSASSRGRYIRSLTLNGQPYASSWLPLAAIARGGSLVFVRGSIPSAWGTAPSSVPPSFPPGNP